MTPDPKPPKRIKDRYALLQFHDMELGCVACSWDRPTEAHHVLSRGQGGDDVLDNLVPLCGSCHRAYHNGSRAPRRMVARFLRSDAGKGHVKYLHSKLDPTQGVFAVEAMVERLER